MRTPSRARWGLLAIAVLVTAVIAGCGDDDGDDKAEELPKAVQVQALDNVFGEEEPHEVRVAVGGTVTWVNDGRNQHNIIPTGKEDYGVGEGDFKPGDTYKATFEAEGRFRYFCSLHGNADDGMNGIVLVGDVEAPPPAPPAIDLADVKASGNTIKVPADYDTIQGAVDAADRGDLILISPGIYKEAVEVPRGKDGLTIRGLDRGKVILDGELVRANGFLVIKANGVSIENMTAQNYTRNGFFWTGVDGYRGSYLTAVRNGDYGVYAFESTHGQLDHSYASGSPDAGFYIGGCQPCDAVIDDVVSEWNGLGYSGTNAGGNLTIANSEFRFNRAGIVPNSGSYEPSYPQDDNVIVGNYVHDNNNGDTAAIDISVVVMGNGIVVAGGINNTVERNRVLDHEESGIAVFTYPENEDYIWKVTGNTVRGNYVRGSGTEDIGFIYLSGSNETGDNCFEGNDFETSSPADIETVLPCPAPAEADMSNHPFDLMRLGDTSGSPDSVPYEDVELPEIDPAEVPNMPDADTAPASPATDVPMEIDTDAIELPAAP